jgi:hypothetical protein
MKEDSVSGLRLVESRDSEQRWPKGAAHLCEDIAKGIVEDEVRRFAVRKRSERLAPLIRAHRERGSGPSRGAFPVRLQLLALAGRVGGRRGPRPRHRREAPSGPHRPAEGALVAWKRCDESQSLGGAVRIDQRPE